MKSKCLRSVRRNNCAYVFMPVPFSCCWNCGLQPITGPFLKEMGVERHTVSPRNKCFFDPLFLREKYVHR